MLTIEPSQVSADIQRLVTSTQHLLLATRDAGDGAPDASLAPFLARPEGFYILVSQLAAHTRNLLADPRCSVLMTADEFAANNLFARPRVQFRCQAVVVPREAPQFSSLTAEMQQALGPTISLLTSLPDFVLFRLEPSQGLVVLGFGGATRFEVCSVENSPN